MAPFAMATLGVRLLHALGSAQRAGPARAFAKAAEDPRAAQLAKLADLLRRNGSAEYGRSFGLRPGMSAAEFARAAPLMTPADLLPRVSRLMAGERGVLTQDAPLYYVRTTGSTGEPKHVPITKAYREEFQLTVQVSLFHLRRRFPQAFSGRALYSVGSCRVAKAADGNDIGTMSGYNFTQMPRPVRALYAWPYELFEVQDLKARTTLALLFAALGDPSIAVGIFPAPIVYLLRELEAQAGALVRPLREGILPADLALPAAQRASLQRLFHADARAAKRLERAAAAPVEEKAHEAWPSLRLVYCWTAASAALYLPELARRLGPGVAVRDAVYSACEGWCSIPMGEAEAGGALAVSSHYFEFIEEEAYARGSRDTVPGWELEQGRRYLIVFSNSSGVWRYLLGDIIEVCGRYLRTPVIRFVRKHGASANLAGEKLEEAHVNQAVGGALSALHLEATFFSLAPDSGRATPGYALHFEPPPGERLAPALLARLAVAVDEGLGKASYDYGRLRAGGQLSQVRLQLLTPGSYDAFRQARVTGGSAEGQLKTAHLVSDATGLPVSR